MSLAPPDLQEWVERYGSYWDIPWEEWDATMQEYNTQRRHNWQGGGWLHKQLESNSGTEAGIDAAPDA